ncbi:LOW QUALITY PROTEIN: hypothetical protein QTO34_007350 [Cnephaeus nilssonii]|uniref:Interferon-related developmental regulator 2 n=1 Tax=Cnephaeus nilssonii TaxID=3371016 RepID=A0AA40HKT2_CNENI|nr:LOW QUALITY PROTEIN: hypothetical protein QTO34_007350 [Eptesicus nilssonii]
MRLDEVPQPSLIHGGRPHGPFRPPQSSAQADSGSSEDEAASEARSTTSDCPSLVSTAADDGLGGDAVDEQGQQEDLEEKLKEYVDCLTDKRYPWLPASPCPMPLLSPWQIAKTRQGALENLRLALASRLLPDFLLQRSLTLADALEKCLKKGKGEEQAPAAALLGLLCVQLGPGPRSEELFHGLQPLLVSVLTDAAASPSARLHCASALGLGCYVAAADVQDLLSCLTCLEGVFSRSCSAGGSTAPANLHGLFCAALQAWALLLTICPSSHISHILDRQLPRLLQLLSSETVNLRIAAGETIALLFELARDLEGSRRDSGARAEKKATSSVKGRVRAAPCGACRAQLRSHPRPAPALQEDLTYGDMDALCGALRTLATDSNKYRAKADRRRQRATFRAVLHFVEGGECEEETIRFGLEVLYVDSWARRRVYTAFKDVLGSGMHHHLQVGRRAGRGHQRVRCPRAALTVLSAQNNELLRDVFGLGPVLVLDAAALKACKVSRFEKVWPLAPCFPSIPAARRSAGLQEKPWLPLPLRSQIPTLPPSRQHLYNAAACKARTKARSRVRDKRADVL